MGKLDHESENFETDPFSIHAHLASAMSGLDTAIRTHKRAQLSLDETSAQMLFDPNNIFAVEGHILETTQNYREFEKEVRLNQENLSILIRRLESLGDPKISGGINKLKILLLKSQIISLQEEGDAK